jgi:hypothetical protein
MRRNALWVTWLRRPLGVALRRTLEMLREPRAIADALGGLGWVLRQRHVLPPQVESMCKRLDAAY